MSYKSSSGYGGLEQTPLARIGYSDEIVMQAWERDFLPEITNTTIDERITQCNQVVQFVRQPIVTPWREYEKNQELIADQITPDGFCMEVCNAKYKAIKFDKMDIKYACERWDAWEESFLQSTYQELTEEWRTFVFTGMILETASTNKGANAGVFGNIDLGQTGAPIIITPTNVISELGKLRQVLKDTQRWEDGKMFVVLPTAIFNVVQQSPASNVDQMGSCLGGCSPIIDGMMQQQLMGFNVIETSHTITATDPSGPLSYYVIAGHREAFAFAADIIEGRLVEPTESFSVQYQMLAVWGGRAILDDAMAIGYWAIQS